jgi:DNA/RNA endonuclease YhcR with UshA esterase domain
MKIPLILLLLALSAPDYLRAQATAAEEPAAAVTEPAATDAAAEVPVIPAEDTASMEAKVGSEVIVEGVVRDVGKGSNDSITFLNFGDRNSGFTVVAFRAVYDKFPEGFDKFSGQKVRVRGQLEKYRDRTMQIRLSTPDQIKVIAGGETPAATP